MKRCGRSTLIVEFPGKRAPGRALPIFLDLVDRGLVRILDIAIFRKELDGTVVRANLAELSPELAAFDGASSGVVDPHDIDNTAELIAPIAPRAFWFMKTAGRRHSRSHCGAKEDSSSPADVCRFRRYSRNSTPPNW